MRIWNTSGNCTVLKSLKLDFDPEQTFPPYVTGFRLSAFRNLRNLCDFEENVQQMKNRYVTDLLEPRER